jgi:hypothetical protein
MNAGSECDDPNLNRDATWPSRNATMPVSVVNDGRDLFVGTREIVILRSSHVYHLRLTA